MKTDANTNKHIERPYKQQKTKGKDQKATINQRNTTEHIRKPKKKHTNTTGKHRKTTQNQREIV
jgi:hypothetical protein